MNRRFVPKKTSILLGLALAAMGSWTGKAGEVFLDFNTDPSLNQLIHVVGHAEWRDSGGATGGATDGYLSITDAREGQSSAILFADLEPGLVVKAFTFEADLRIGGGTAQPADGFSINFVSADDPLIDNLLAGQITGFAGVADEASLPEEGSRTGLGIGFDTWQSAGPTGIHGSIQDVVGISVRVDGQLLAQFPVPLRPGNVYLPNHPPPGQQGDLYVYNEAPFRNLAVEHADYNASMQTGARNDAPGFDPNAQQPQWWWDPEQWELWVARLTWEPFRAELTEDQKVKIFWKGVELTPAGGLQTDFAPRPGRIVFAGRTGGAWEVHHVDNIRLTTIPAENVIVGPATGTPTGFNLTILDSGPAIVDPNTIQVRLNGELVAPTSPITKQDITTTFAYSNPAAPLQPGSTHTLQVTVSDTRGLEVTAERTFTVPAYVTLPPGFAVTDVNTAAPGFRVRIHQVETGQPNTVARAEQQLAGLRGENIWDMSQFTDNGYYIETSTINYNQDAPVQAGFFGDDLNFPGQWETDPNNMAAEILTYLHFPQAGTYTLIFNSDDGFRTYTYTNPREQLNSIIVSQFDDGRGASDTLALVYVSEAGYYPFRTVWFEGAGGANMEWSAITPGGTRALINDTTNPNALRAYRTRTGTPPAAVTFTNPVRGSGNPYHPLTPIQVNIQDGPSAVDQGSIQLQVNGAAVTPTISKAGTTTTAIYTPTTPYPSGATNTVQVNFTAGAQQYTASYTFVASTYASVPVSMALPESAVNRNAPGFLVRTVQSDYPTGSALPNHIYRAETQLAGLLGWPNTADLGMFQADGYYRETQVINYVGSGGAGQFPDALGVPGIPGTAQFEAGGGNYSQEILTVIEFTQPGLYTMNVNSDDGFQTAVGNPRDAIRLVLGQFNDGRGVNGGTSYSFWIPQAGLYPFRTIWFEGGGGDAIEWTSITPAGQRILINDTSTPGHLKAFQYPLTSAGAAYIEDFSPARAGRGNRAAINASVSAILVDGVNPVDPATVTLSVGGTAVQPTVTKTGNRTTVTYQPATAFNPGSQHPVSLTFNGRTVNWTFQVGALPKASFFIEAEDFNYDSGQTRPEASQMPYKGGAYSGLSAVLGVDYQRPHEPSGQFYRLGEQNNVPMSFTGDRDRNELGEIVVNYRVGWIGEGQWYNYTRTIPQGEYNIYAAMSHDGANPNMLRGTLQRVTAGSNTANQTLEQLGSFNAGATGGWDNIALVPMRTEGGDTAAVPLSGQTTLRFTTSSGDIDFLLLVPTQEVEPGDRVAVARDGNNVTITWEGAGTLEQAESITGPWTAVATTGTSYTTAITGAQRFFRLRQ
jgi:hypothetical protein